MKRKVDDLDVQVALELTAMCETFHTLPSAGGLLDQDPLLIYMMREVLVAQKDKAEAEKRK